MITILKEFTKKICYGFGFGFGMGVSYLLINKISKNNKVLKNK